MYIGPHQSYLFCNFNLLKIKYERMNEIHAVSCQQSCTLWSDFKRSALSFRLRQGKFLYLCD